MSFGIYVQGSKATVLARLDESRGHGDASHHDAIRDAIKAIVATAPDSATIGVECSGHHHFDPSAVSGSQIGNVVLNLRISAG